MKGRFPLAYKIFGLQVCIVFVAAAAGVLTAQSTAEAVRRATGASYVVVTDRRGIRFSWPAT